jgi:methionine-gamma-lyase
MKKRDTRIVHEQRFDVGEEIPAMPPIYQSSTFAFPRAEVLGDTISGGPDNEIYIYTRGSNPTQRTLENSVANVEGAEEGLVTSSGMAAMTLIALTFLDKDSHAILSSVTYGDTHHLYHEIMSRFGVATDFVDMTDPENVRRAIRPNTKLILFETPSNPLLRLIDINAMAELAKDRDIRVVVDNTVMSPYYQQPLNFGADIVVHSLSKYINGHSDVVGGIILSSREDRLQLRFNLFSTGPSLDPHACYLILRGLKTLHVRVRQQQQNVLKVVNFLAGHAGVKAVYHPSLSDHPDYELARRQMSGMPMIVTFELHGDLAVARDAINRLQVFRRAVSLGGVESLAEHPATMTHAIMPPEHRLAHGITDTLLRLSIGIEDAEDLVADLKQALPTK